LNPAGIRNIRPRAITIHMTDSPASAAISRPPQQADLISLEKIQGITTPRFVTVYFMQLASLSEKSGGDGADESIEGVAQRIV
jgi:hypothetical protein